MGQGLERGAAVAAALMLLAAAAATSVRAQAPAELLQRAEAGDASAQYEMGRLYERGEQVARDDFEAVRWFARAAESGSARAALDYGWMLANGYGVTQDEAAAYYWFARAAAAGMPGADDQRDALAGRLDAQAKQAADARVAALPGPDRDPAASSAVQDVGAAPLPEQDLRDVFALRRAYNSPGRGDDAAQRPAVRRQAELGDPLAQNLLGVMLMRATGRAAKLEALEWFRSAAWANLPAAQFNLADALALGVGGERDLRGALGLLQEAEAGLPSGTPTTYEGAAQMFQERAEFVDPYLAAMQGYRSAATELGQLIQMRRSEVLAQLEMARRLGQ